MRAAIVILRTILILVILSGVVMYIRKRSLDGFMPIGEIVLGTLIGLYAYKKETNQQKQGLDT